MGDPSIVIVGAGIAGLSTGIYGRLNGYRTTILESHRIPGGLCTAWKRKGYTFDLSMHMLVGSKNGPFHRMWRELGVIQGSRFAYPKDEVLRVVGRSKTLRFCIDPHRLGRHLEELSPADASRSREIVRLLAGPSVMNAAVLKADELISLPEKLKMGMAMLPLIGSLRRYGRTTLQQFAGSYQDPFLREAIRFFLDSPSWWMPDYPMFGLAGFLAAGIRDAGTPIGGSQKVVFSMEERYRALGGEVRYGSRVTGILLEGDRAVGVRLEDGSEIRADVVVWAADAHTAIFDLLGGRYLDARIRRMFEEWKPVQPLVQVCLGVARDLSAEPLRTVFELDPPLEVAGEPRKWISVLQRSHDSTMAPAGKTVVEVWYPTSFEYWENLAADRTKYEAEKKRIADGTIAELDRRWPGFAGQVEVVDVPTPLTYARYTGNWKGSPDGWCVTIGNVLKRTPLRGLPGLAGFHLVGQWTAPYTGTVIAALSGRQAIELLCRRAGRPFNTIDPCRPA